VVLAGGAVYLFSLRRRDSGYPEPPPQTRTCGFPASGSSVALAFARTVTVARSTVQLLSPRSEVGSCLPDPACPARVSFASCVLPSGPSPCGRLSRPQTTMPDKTPRRHAAVPRLPVRSLFNHSTRAHAVSGLITRSCPNADDFMVSPRPGAFGASRVLRRLSSCMPRPDDSGGHPRTGQNVRFMLASRSLTLSPSAGYVSRSCPDLNRRTSGSAISPTAYRILCVRLPCNSLCSQGHKAPQQDQHSIRVDG
jgi:hypothetical protein